MTKLARPLGAAVAVQVNYGSDATCTGGGDPAEAAAWVAYARKKHYDVRLWTIGNEQWADFALDLHVTTHDPWRYSWEINTRYYPMMKAADPAIQIGIDVEGTADSRWDSIVLKYAKYDFVDVHVYPEMPPHDDDWLLRQGPDGWPRSSSTCVRRCGGPGARRRRCSSASGTAPRTTWANSRPRSSKHCSPA